MVHDCKSGRVWHSHDIFQSTKLYISSVYSLFVSVSAIPVEYQLFQLECWYFNADGHDKRHSITDRDATSEVKSLWLKVKKTYGLQPFHRCFRIIKYPIMQSRVWGPQLAHSNKEGRSIYIASTHKVNTIAWIHWELSSSIEYLSINLHNMPAQMSWFAKENLVILALRKRPT